MLTLYGSLASPYVRKIRVLIEEAGLREFVCFETVSLSPTNPDPVLSMKNPLGKIPVLELEDGNLLYDSRVIAEYLDTCHSGRPFLPPTGPLRWEVLRQEALADGILDAGVLIRYETFLRPEALRWDEWIRGQARKIMAALDHLEQNTPHFAKEPDLGLIAIACAFGWLHFRQPLNAHPDGPIDLAKNWPRLQAWFEHFNQRPSMQATLPMA